MHFRILPFKYYSPMGLALFLVCFVGAMVLFASPTQALTATPIRLELEGDKGQTLRESMELYNDKNETFTYYLYAYNFEVKNETGEPLLTNTPGGLASWIKLEQSITLGPKERQSISFNIEIPDNIDPGGYFAAVVGSTKAPNSNPEELSIEGEVGTLVLLQVKGEFIEGADILDFGTVNKRRIFSSLPVDFSFRFQNSGESWLKPMGDINIKNIFAGTSQVISANPNGNNVLPKSIRAFTVSWLSRSGEVQDPKTERPPVAPKGFWNNVKHEWKYFALGRYKANLTLTYGADQKHAFANTVFWVFPWHLLVLVSIALIIELSYRKVFRWLKRLITKS